MPQTALHCAPPATASASASARRHGVPLAVLAAASLAIAAVGNLLLPAFLGLSPVVAAVLMLAGVAALSVAVVRGGASAGDRVSWQTIGGCLVIAGIVLLLGGEGRFLSASPDWRVRDAVLADLGGHRWPFHYAMPGGDALLRAPLGMYLLPSLVGGWGQRALDLALLACNTLTLGLLLALASALFEAGAPRRMAAWTLFLFSGLDAIGTLAMRAVGRPAALIHIENWGEGSQYTAPFTQITWAPQHAIAGWACALFYLLWQQRKLPIGCLAAAVPLFAFWSPVAAAGALPFALLAAVRGARALRWRDAAMGGIAVAIALPALIYQHAGAASVGAGWNPILPSIYALAVAIEVLPLVLPVLLQPVPSRFGRDTLILALVVLVLAPLVKIGIWKDFQMRITIVPLIVTAAAFADALTRAHRDGAHARKALLATILAIGSLTVVSELFSPLTMRPSPVPRCTVVNAWERDPIAGRFGPPNTYVTPVDTLPAFLRAPPKAMADPAKDPIDCLGRPWFTPAWTGR